MSYLFTPRFEAVLCTIAYAVAMSLASRLCSLIRLASAFLRKTEIVVREEIETVTNVSTLDLSLRTIGQKHKFAHTPSQAHSI